MGIADRPNRRWWRFTGVGRCVIVLSTAGLISFGSGLEVAQAQTTAQHGSRTVQQWSDQGDPLPVGAIARLGTIRFRHQAEINDLFYAPDRRFIVSAGGGTIRFWESKTGRQVRMFRIPYDGNPYSISTHAAMSPDGKRVYAAATFYDLPKGVFCFNGRFLVSAVVCVFDAAKGRLLRKVDRKEGWTYDGLTISPDGNTIAIGASLPGKKDRIARLSIWDTKNFKAIVKYDTDGGRVSAVRFSPSGRLLAFGTGNQVHLWKAGKQVRKWPVKHSVRSLAFTPDERHLAAACGFTEWRTSAMQGELQVWDTMKGTHAFYLHDKSATFDSVEFTSDGTRLAYLKDSRGYEPSTSLSILAWPTGKPIGKSHDAGSVLMRTPGGNTLFTGDSTGRIRRWNLKTAKPLQLLSEFTPSSNVVFSPDGDAVGEIISNYDYSTEPTIIRSELRLWSVDRRRVVKSLKLRSIVGAELVSRNTMIAVSANGVVRRINIQDGTSKRLWKMKLNEADGDLSLADKVLFAPLHIAVFRDGGNSATGKDRLSAYSRSNGIRVFQRSAEFSSFGKECVAIKKQRLTYLRTENGQDRVKAFDIAKQSQVASFAMPAESLRGLAISSDNRRVCILESYVTGRRPDLFLGSNRGFVDTYSYRMHVRDAATGKKLLSLDKLAGERIDAAPAPISLSPNGKLLVLGDGTGRLTIFDVDQSREVVAVTAHQRKIESINFSADGRRMLTKSEDNTAIVWDVKRLLSSGER